ncbi:hypothetical protein P153DRAFT_46925 [Dothidotthia symphoricarpi CBS 119687]|uniref:Uncharacterized protein n=1 Tax=Dothidotthia symphoricarpi CBS 119687 TaxID=1392245 RepID=A0A6A6AAZ1_9PLEO|nr:uncharacterized protein P153DRAFT_46925 [Dothidotthia symphoricarpi CBS 119687]KAF2128027.1 hypothetical protein P153DRAFT_46925 [Dothidotthia symphoricarpi CBS 119687]
MLIPSNFTVLQPPAGGRLKISKKALRLSRIFVSQRTTVYNGRLNWNIPKYLARFSFSTLPTPKGNVPPHNSPSMYSHQAPRTTTVYTLSLLVPSLPGNGCLLSL